MDEKIIVYGMSKKQFPTEQDLIDYLTIGLSRDKKNRFRYTQCKEAHIIVISMNGLAYGHLTVQEKIPPSDDDKNKFAPVKCTYLINEAIVYNNHVSLYTDLGIRVEKFGTPITQEQFVEIQNKAGLSHT